MKKLIALVILLSFALGIALYGQLPDSLAVHWNANGAANGYADKAWAVLLLPILEAAIAALLLWLPKIDPLGKNVDKFRPAYETFVLALVAFLAYVHALGLWWNLHPFNFFAALIPGLAAFFYALGWFLKRTEQSWFIGIRTPWTLSSPDVWKKTHAMAGKLFQAAAVAMLVGLALPTIALPLVIGLILAVALASVVYSYVEFQKLSKNKDKK